MFYWKVKVEKEGFKMFPTVWHFYNTTLTIYYISTFFIVVFFALGIIGILRHSKTLKDANI